MHVGFTFALPSQVILKRGERWQVTSWDSVGLFQNYSLQRNICSNSNTLEIGLSAVANPSFYF